MNILLDTHIILWFLLDDPRLTDSAREIIFNPRNKVYYSIISIWEVSIKHHNRPVEMNTSGVEFLMWYEKAGFTKLPLDDRHVCALETLQKNENCPEHKDPFDKMLLAQAKGDGMTLLTHDAKFKSWDEPYYHLI